MKSSVSTVDQIKQAIDMLVEGCDFYKHVNTDTADISVSELMQVMSTEKQRAIDALTELIQSLTEDATADNSENSIKKSKTIFPSNGCLSRDTIKQLVDVESDTLAILDSALKNAPNSQIIRAIRQVRIRLQQCQDALGQLPGK